MNLLLSVIGLALATLRENKIRSFLTLLGVMIGTGTIIGVGSILTGLDQHRDRHEDRTELRRRAHAGATHAPSADV
jgi:hypothetical protein